MTEFPHDEFVKEYIPELMGEYGMIKVGETLNREMKEIDVFFIPQKSIPTSPETLGLYGNDTLMGGDGNDTLIGDKGADTLTKGTGVDWFVFKYADESIDKITDFSVAQEDKIMVSASGFGGGLTANANLTNPQFLLGNSITNASQRFIYNSGNGSLFFDRDGNGIIPII